MPEPARIPIGSSIAAGIDWLTTHLDAVFKAIAMVLQGFGDVVYQLLSAPPPFLLALILAVPAFLVTRRLGLPIFTVAAFLLVDGMKLWDATMNTLAVVIVAAVIAVVVGAPLGIWAATARSASVSVIIRPVLDFMQTLPVFVYLLPAVFFFGIGAVPGIVATMVFAVPPAVRLTELGIRQVDREVVEASRAFGATRLQVLREVQLPLAVPTIMAGVNQMIMLALSMVVVAGMVGAPGLGQVVVASTQTLDVAGGFEGGIAVVVLAVYLDRVTSGLASLRRRRGPKGRRPEAAVKETETREGGQDGLSTAPAPASGGGTATPRRSLLTGGDRRTAIAVVVAVVMAIGVVGYSHDRGESLGGGGGDDSKEITIGAIPWDEDIAVTELWKQLLEAKGYKVNVQQLDAGPLFSGVASGSLDFFMDAWLPSTHAAYWKQFGPKINDLGSWYRPADLGLAVPDYVEVHSLTELAAGSAQFGGKIIGIEASAGEMNRMKNTVMPAYGLTGRMQLVQSSTPAMLTALDKAYKAKRPIVVTLWRPHWAFSKYKIRYLTDPKKAWGRPDEIHTIASKKFSETNPVVSGWLRNLKLDARQLQELENMINTSPEDGKSAAVSQWISQNKGLTDSWMN